MKRGKPIARSGRPKRVNAKRKAREWARAYGSEARVLFVQGLRCACGCGVKPCEVAHVGNGGMSRKADAAQTLPLAPECHRKQHQKGWESIGMNVDEAMEIARAVENIWQRRQG